MGALFRDCAGGTNRQVGCAPRCRTRSGWCCRICPSWHWPFGDCRRCPTSMRRECSLEDSLLTEFGLVDFVLNAPTRHRVDAMTDVDELREFRRYNDDCRALTSQAMDQPIDLGLCADVDAAGRLIKDQDIDASPRPFCDHEFLLIAAGSRHSGGLQL